MHATCKWWQPIATIRWAALAGCVVVADVQAEKASQMLIRGGL